MWGLTNNIIHLGCSNFETSGVDLVLFQRHVNWQAQQNQHLKQSNWRGEPYIDTGNTNEQSRRNWHWNKQIDKIGEIDNVTDNVNANWQDMLFLLQRSPDEHCGDQAVGLCNCALTNAFRRLRGVCTVAAFLCYCHVARLLRTPTYLYFWKVDAGRLSWLRVSMYLLYISSA